MLTYGHLGVSGEQKNLQVILSVRVSGILLNRLIQPHLQTSSSAGYQHLRRTLNLRCRQCTNGGMMNDETHLQSLSPFWEE